MRAILARIAMITLLFSTASIVIPLSIERPSEALGSSRCPDGYHRSPSGDCESVQGGSSASESSSNNDDDDDDGIDSESDNSVGDNEIRSEYEYGISI
jgi:hypothetical protein